MSMIIQFNRMVSGIQQLTKSVNVALMQLDYVTVTEIETTNKMLLAIEFSILR